MLRLECITLEFVAATELAYYQADSELCTSFKVRGAVALT